MQGKYPVISLIFKHIKEDSFISAKEQQSAEHLLVRLEQQYIFNKQFMVVAKGTKEKLNDQLGLYEKDGILRCARHYKNLLLKQDTKYPVLIAHQGQLARLIINEAHLRTMHMGLQATLTEVRQKW